MAETELAGELGAGLRALLRPGMTAVDVGAGAGESALLMAELVGPSGRVLAVEADPGRSEALREKAARGDGAAIEVVSTISLWERGPHNLDQALARPEVDLLLIDADAAPHVSLYGARWILDHCRPSVLVAFRPQRLRETGADPVTVLDGYRALGLVPVAGDGLPADPGELVRAVDSAAQPCAVLRLERVDPAPAPLERLLPAPRRLGRAWKRRFPSQPPRTLAYDATHRALVASLLDSEEWRAVFAAGGRLPPGLGFGFDERVVEYPWAFSRGLSGRVLDAGSVFNHRHVVERLLPAVEELSIATLAPEPAAFTELGISYLYADLRDLPLRDGWFDDVVCLSTLEHVGMDNSGYGTAAPRAEDPRAEAAQALRELLRVVRPGGRVHLSVPFGRREDHGWLRQLDRDDVDDLLRHAGAGRRDEAVFAHTPHGWRRVDPKRAARTAYNPGPERGEDGAVAARAVWCATIHAE